MKKLTFLFCFLFINCTVFCQNNSIIDWKADLNYLNETLIQKEFLFNKLSKTEFNNQVNQLKNELHLLKNDEIYWQFHKLLSLFKNQNLKVLVQDQKLFPFEVKWLKSGIYLTKLPKEFNYVLGQKLIAINNTPIKEIIEKVKTVVYQNNTSIRVNFNELIKNKSLLSFLNIITNDTIQLTTVSKNQESTSINLVFNELITDDNMSEIIPKKILFYQTKKDKWFWKYGINFGKQVYFKYNVCLSKEYINKIKDSLNITEKDISKIYHLPLQKIYEAVSIDEMGQKIVEKFEKKRYKKLIIDFRGNQIGSLLTSKKLIKQISKIRRINKKGNIFILTDRHVLASAIATIIAFQKHTKVIIIGEEIVDTIDDTNQLDSFYLPNSNLKIQVPKNYKTKNTVKPNILIEPTFEHYKNGVDILLQKALEY
jgi:hypothetical protein